MIYLAGELMSYVVNGKFQGTALYPLVTEGGSETE